MSQLDAIDDALLALPDDADIDTLDFTKYELLCTALGEDHTPETLETKTLNQLIAEATGDSFTLEDDFSISDTITINKQFTLDLNGHIITYTGDTGSVIKVESGGNLTLKDSGSGGKITGGKATDDTSQYGGGVYVTKGATFNMESGTITGCNAKWGGGVAVHGGTFTMSGGTITNCTTPSDNDNRYGGGVYVCRDTDSALGSFTMNGGTIENCSSYNGGGVSVAEKSAFTMNNGTISDCSATRGGGVYITGNFTMQGGTITNCKAQFGGGVEVGGISFTMSGGAITNCTATDSGGGVYVTMGDFKMTGGTISGNTSSNLQSNGIYASTMYPYGGTVEDTCIISEPVTNNTVYTTFNETVYISNTGNIYHGTYNGNVENSGKIYGGTFNGTVTITNNDAIIYGGTFNGRVVINAKERIRWSNNSNEKTLIINAGFTYGLDAFEKTRGEIKENITNNWSILHEIFDADGGTPTTQTLTFVNATSQPDKNKVSFPISDPTKEGHTFGGWYNGDTEYNYYTTSHAASDKGVHEVTYKAKWTADSYNIVYDLDGGTIAATNPATYTYGVGVASFAAPTRTGYVFKGWVDEEGKTVTSISETQTGEVTLKAQWERASYTLAFNSNGGTDVAPTVGVHGTVIDLTQAKYRPTRYGYIFTGWYTDGKLTTRVASLTLTENTTLVAGWTLNTWVGPHTGDDSNIALYAALMGGSLLLIAAAAVVIIKKKKRK